MKTEQIRGEVTIELSKIEERIFTIRGKQVMIDKDLALLYGVETKRLNEQVKRNIERFPEDFMFQLTMEECLRSQFATLNQAQGQHLKYLPYAFTENGIAMLSSVLRSETAIAVNIKIMRTFSQIRKSVYKDSNLSNRVELIEYNMSDMRRLLIETTDKVDSIFESMKGTSILPIQGIFFDGQIFDAYTFVSDLIRKAIRRIVLIDNYIDDTVLTLLDKRFPDVTATLYTGKLSKTVQLDISKHNSQYAPIEIKTFDKAHDRFLIIDDDVYLIGASIKDLGKKWFGFTRMENTDADELIGRI
ncbi:MAG: ORF6N domain-containing protein [Bacteroidales bacterium]|nr:ORF6N domain-containing protein [Bacteroidales bacterium]